MMRQILLLLSVGLAVGCADPATAPRALGSAPVLAVVTAPLHWGLDRIDQQNLPLSQTAYYGANRGAGVRIYIIDSGVNPNHPELIGRVSLGVDLTGGDGSDCLNHGTGVAAMAAGTTVGVAPEAQVVNVRMDGCVDDATVAEMAAAVDWVRVNAIQPAVANISWAEPLEANDVLVQAVEALVASGVTVTVGAGNSIGDACTLTPGAASSALTVGGTSITDARFVLSNGGPCVDLWAPAQNLITATHFAFAYQQTSGTSLSAPMVAGAAARILSENPNWTPAQVGTELLSTATAGVLTGLPAGSPNLLLRVPASITPPPHNASFTGTCSGVTCSFIAVESGVWYLAMEAAYGLTASRTAGGTWVVRHTVNGNAWEMTVTCNSKKCRI